MPARSKFFWLALFYFSSGFPLGIFYDIFPVYFRQQGIDLKSIGLISLLGLSWTLKFIWAPAVDYYRRHRLWMAMMDLLMGAVMIAFALHSGLGAWVWIAIGLFTLMSATNDIAIDAYSIELLQKGETGVGNGLRIGFYRVGMLAAGVVLILSDYLSWRGAFITGAAIFLLGAAFALFAPKEEERVARNAPTLGQELVSIARNPAAFAVVLLFLLGVLKLFDNGAHWSKAHPAFWPFVFALAAPSLAGSLLLREKKQSDFTAGPMFGALMSLLSRKHVLPVLAFILLFKLPDTAMGFMLKPFWVDSGFSNAEIGLVSVNIGLVLSIAGGLAGGWITDRIGVFRALWMLGLFQGCANLGYVLAASLIPHGAGAGHKLLMYGASAVESFNSGLGTAAFLAFLMAIVDRERSAAEYALLSSVFALSRSLAGWAGGIGAESLGYAPYFLLTFFLMFPAYLFLPWVKKMLVERGY